LPAQIAKYTAVSAGERLYQAEIVTGLVQIQQSVATIGGSQPKLIERLHPFAIILTQDCDLEQDFTARSETVPGTLNSVLLCEVVTASELKGNLPKGKDIWKRVIQNKDERYQCLEAVPIDLDADGNGLPSLGCDFKKYFTVPADDFYKRLDLGQITRRSRLISPYTEHLLHRFCNFQSRVPLPDNHNVEISGD